MTKYVQFADKTKKTVVAEFGAPQDPEQWPNYATVKDTDARYLAWLNPVQDRDAFRDAIQAALDAGAAVNGYDSILTAVSYLGDPSPKFNSEGQAFLNWRSAVWVYANEQLALVLAGKRQQPTIDDFLKELPALEMPK